MNSTAQNISQRLKAFLEQKPDNVQLLLRAGVKSAFIDQAVDGTIQIKNLYIIAQKLYEVAGVNIRDIYFEAAITSVFGGEPKEGVLSDISSFDRLATEFGNLLSSMSTKKACAYFGIADKVVARKWLVGWPSQERIEQMLRFVKESREGTVMIPLSKEREDQEMVDASCRDWRERLRDLRKKEPLRYSRPNISEKIGVSQGTVKHWLAHTKFGDPSSEQMRAMQREFPELFQVGVAKAEAVSTSVDALSPAMALVSQQKALSSLVSMMFSAINVIAAVVDPRQVVEGEQARIVEVVERLFAATGINRATFARLSNVELLGPNDPAIDLLFGKKHK